MRNVSLALAFLQLVTVRPPVTTDILWVIADDRTASLTRAAFGKFPAWNREIILPMVQPGNTVSLQFVDHERNHSAEDPQTVGIDARLRQFTADVIAFDDRIRRQKQASRSSQTDLGKLFHDLRQNIDVDKMTKTTRTYVLVALTDGVPDGPQTVPPQPLPAVTGSDYRIVFLGVEEGTEMRLRVTAANAGFADRDRMLVVPHAIVDQSVAAIQKFVGRPVNAALAQSLKRAATQVSQTTR